MISKISPTSTSVILLECGTILQHDENDNVRVLRETDLLIRGNIIAKIGKNLRVEEEDAQILDCRGKIISPGFVDTHHHVWQTQLKGRHSDDTLLDYTAKGNWQPFNYTARDVFWGELGGLMEAVDGGTTCVVDHAHMAYSPSHGLAGFAAILTSGIRSVYCLSITPRIKEWNGQQLVTDEEIVPDWFFDTLQDLQRRTETLDGTVQIGFGFDSYNLPREEVVRVFRTAREVGAKVLTSHWRRNVIAGTGLSVPEALDEYGLLKSDIILSHATGSTEHELDLLRKAGAFVSATPATESQMAHGDVIGFRKDVNGSIGADCHSNNPASLLHSMQVGLAVARSHRNSQILGAGKFPKVIEPSTLHAFNLATICGARAAGLADVVGSLVEGKAADIVVFDGTTPSMCCAVEHDPVVAIVRHAGVQEIDTVIVNGAILKRGGRLVDVTYAGPEGWEGSEKVTAVSESPAKVISWKTVAEQLRITRLEIQQRIDRCDMQVAKDKIIHMWGSSGGDEIFA